MRLIQPRSCPNADFGHVPLGKPQARVITLQQLALRLGLEANIDLPVMHTALACDERHIGAGELLYGSTQKITHFFLVESGIVEVMHPDRHATLPIGAPRYVMYAGRQALLGLGEEGQRFGHQALALTNAIVLAIPRCILSHLSSAAWFLSEALWQRASIPLFRGWQLAYELQALAPAEQLLKVLRYVAELARSERAQQLAQPIRLSVSTLQAWLGWTADQMQSSLQSLAVKGGAPTLQRLGDYLWLEAANATPDPSRFSSVDLCASGLALYHAR